MKMSHEGRGRLVSAARKDFYTAPLSPILPGIRSLDSHGKQPKPGLFERKVILAMARNIVSSGKCSSLLLLLLIAPFASAQDVRLTDYLQNLREAQARSAAKQWSEAAALWSKVVATNPNAPEYWDQLATARYLTRDYRGAIMAYEKTFELGYFKVLRARDIAHCYGLLGNKELSLTWLDKSLALRYPDLERLQTDPAFSSLRDEPRFRELVGLVDTSKMSRDEGWRVDLRLLAREVVRKGYDPFHLVSKKNFDEAVAKLGKDIPKLTDVEIIIEFMKLLRNVGDGHTGLLLGPERPEFRTALPVQFYFFKEGLFIIATEPAQSNLIGAQVLSFGDKSVEQVMTALDPLISRDHENKIWPLQIAPYLMRYPALLNGLHLISDQSKVTLTIRDLDGRTAPVTLAANSPESVIWNKFPQTWVTLPQKATGTVPLYIKRMSEPYWFEYLSDSRTVYFQFNLVRNDPKEPLAEFRKRLFKFIDDNEVARLVIDIRWNNGGNANLLRPLIHDLIRNDKINRAGKLFVIIGRRTFSAAQDAAALLERHTNVIFVGEPTGSSPNYIGEEDFFTLPYSRVPINVSDLFHQTAHPQDTRMWIAPQIFAPPSFELYRTNRDPAMEAIAAYQEAP